MKEVRKCIRSLVQIGRRREAAGGRDRGSKTGGGKSRGFDLSL